MPFGLREGLQIGGGLLGLFGGSRRNAEAAGYLRQGMGLNQAAEAGVRDAITAARGYDPEREDQASVDFARKQAGQTLDNTLRDLNQRWRNQGGGLKDTALSGHQLRTYDQALDPLEAFLAQLKSTQTARRVNVLGQAVSQSGPIIRNYMQASGQYERSLDGPMAMLSGGIDQALKPGQGESGGGGAEKSNVNSAEFGDRYHKARDAVNRLRRYL